MKKRLVVITLTALLIVSLAVSVNAEFYEPEFEQVAHFSSYDGSWVVIPNENNTALVKIVVDGNFESLSQNYPVQIFLTTTVNGVIEQRTATFYEPTTQLVFYVYGDYSAQTQYEFMYVVLGADIDTITSVTVYAAPISFNGTYDEGYSDGYDDATNISGALGSAFNGFFNGLANFMNVILDIGIGSLTVKNLLGICTITLLVVTLIKIVRGS